MSNDLKFRFYAVVKDEDAPPFLSDNLLVVADGLGGAGSSIHKIDRVKHDDLKEELLSTAYADFDGETLENLRPYLDELMESMIDEKDDTSALWASRIIIGRFVYALTKDDYYSAEKLKDEAVRQELVEFISRGLYNTAEHFDLKCSDISGTRLLPSTLAAIRYREVEDNVLAEAIWAGDSRLYAFTNDGMKLISEDDEDGSGALINLFYASETQKTKLHYRTFYLPKPCILMAVSDGIFDPFSPFDSVGTESVFMTAIQNHASFEEVAENLKNQFLSIRADDATVSFKAIGFDSYEQIKSHYSERAKYVSEMWIKRIRLKETLEVLNLSPEEANSYVSTRTLDKYPKICEILTASYAAGENDVALSGEYFTNNIKAKQEEIVNEAIAEKKKNNNNSLDGIFNMLRESPSIATFKTVFADSNAYTKKDNTLRENVKNLGKELAYSIKMCNEKLEKYNYFKKEKDSFVAIIGKIISATDAKIAEYEVNSYAECSPLESNGDAKLPASVKDFKENWKKGTESNRAKILDLKEYKNYWENVRGDIVMLRHPSPCNVKFESKEAEKLCRYIEKTVVSSLTESKSHFNLFRALEAHVEDSLTCLYNYALEHNKMKTLSKKYDIAVSNLKKHICNNNAYRKFFKRSILEKFDFDTSDDSFSNIELSREEILPVIAELLKDKETAAASIVSSLANNYESSSAIDSCYNAKRLSQFREYHRLAHTPKETLIEFDNELNALEASYSSLKPL